MKRKAAFYIRLSDADEEVKKGIKDESNSISAQRELLYSFVEKSEEFKEYEVLEYFDDGISGTLFGGRENFQKMMEDARNGSFECIFVKDFSRFGRDYLEVGNYLEYVFPLMGIRFVSVNDGYDSEKSIGMTGGMDVAFRNLIYQLYSRDLSKKVKSARQNRNRNGEYTGAFVAYGYRKDPDDHHSLLVMEEEAAIIREIFEKSVSGKNCAIIARELNARGVPTRLKTQWQKSRYVPVHDHGDSLWDGNEVNAILRNEAYTGVLIQNKYEVQGFGDSRKLKKRKKEDWSIVENGIPAIISRELFERAQENCQPNRGKARPVNKVNLFECPYCGRKLQKTRCRNMIVCRVRNMTENSLCGRIMMPMEEVERKVLETVREACVLIMERENMVGCHNDAGKGAVKTQIEALMKEKEQIEQSVIDLYRDYRSGVLSKEEYSRRRTDGQQRVEEIEAAINELSMNPKEPEKVKDQEEAEDCRQLEIFNPDVLSKIVSKVYVYDNKNIEVVFKSDDFLKKSVGDVG